MSSSDSNQQQARQEQELKIRQQIAFASGIFQADITIRTLLESLAEGVVIIDNSGTILLVNTRAEQMFGYPEKELIGQPHAVLIPERIRIVHEGHMAHFFAEPKIRPMGLLLDLVGLRRDGSEFPLEISLSFIETINGILVMAFISDITLRKQHEAHLRETEELFRIQVEGVKDYAFFMLDTKGNVLNWNGGAERLKGYKEKEIIGKHFSCFYTEEDRNAGKPDEELKKADVEGRVTVEGWRIRKDGRRFWADVIITALYNESGYLRGFSKVTHDITERKKATDALRFSEARYRTLFQHNPTMIFTIDTDWTILSANLFSAKQLGYTIDELEGQSILEVFHEDDRPAVIEKFRICLQNTDQIYRWQFRKVRKDRELLWVEETAQAVYDLKGALNLLVVCQDITERKQAEDALKNSEEKLRFASTAADIGMWHWDLVHNELTLSERCKELFGYPPDYPMTYEAFLQPIYEDDRHRIDEAIQKALQDKTDYLVEMRILTPDGQERWVMSKGRGFYDETGKPVRMHGIAMDITERKQTEVKIQYYASFPLVNPNPILELDVNGNMTFCNPVAKQIMENAGKKNGIHPLIPQDMPQILQDLRGKKAGQLHREIEINGRFFEELIYIAPPFQSVRIYTMDITERKQADEVISQMTVSLAENAAELVDANKDLEAFNYTVAHDLRNPLNTLSLSCQAIEMMCNDQLNEECKGYVRNIYNSTLQMNELIDALLTFSRMGHVEPHREKIDLCVLAQEVVTMLQQTEPERRVDFRISNGIEANGDASLLRVVLDNLLGNAWKYTVRQEKAVIEFGARVIDGELTYFVRDNGDGFDKAEAAKLFVPFQRLPGAERSKGFGIGLATVERIIRRHGGRIWAEGEPGKGATFSFTLAVD